MMIRSENLSALKDLKWAFYDWCASLTIDEIVSNEPLIEVIERVERMLVGAELATVSREEHQRSFI